MSARTRICALVAILGSALALPAAASAHASLVRTSPVASSAAPSSPARVTLTYSEPIEPRFAAVSVTDADGRQVTNGRPTRAVGDATTLSVPVEHLAQGWYLVYWRVISADGHPVRGAFTFAVGPQPGPAPQFVVPSISETAATPQLVVARALVFVTLLMAIGLIAFRLGIARPVAQVGASTRPLALAAFAALGAGAIAVAVYLELATAQFALRSAWDIGAVVPLIRDAGFGRAYADLLVAIALLGGATICAVAVDRPLRAVRSVAELLALAGCALAALACLLVPGLAGHAANTHPAALAVALDVVHLTAAALWFGGLVGLILLGVATRGETRLAALRIVVPRFSRVALASIVAVTASGTAAAIEHLPTVASLYSTSYGRVILLKVALLALAAPLGATNLLRTRPRLVRAEPADAPARTARRLRQLVSGEVVIATAILVAAALLTSLSPPARALASIGTPRAVLGPGQTTGRSFHEGPYTVTVGIAPNRAAIPNTFSIGLARNGQPVRDADVVVRFTMLDMEMGQVAYRLAETAPGTYARTVPALVMVGHWGLDYAITPAHGSTFHLLVRDRAAG